MVVTLRRTVKRDVMGEATAVALVRDQLLPAFNAERKRLSLLDDWLRWDNEDVQTPKRASDEHKELAKLAKSPVLRLIVKTVVQSLYVDGYRSPETNDQRTPWSLWESNDMDGRQVSIHRAAVGFGVAYATGLPGRDVLTNEATAVFRGVSPRKMLAFYEDPAEDDWPMYAIRVEPAGAEYMIRLYDDHAVHYLGTVTDTTGKKSLVYIEHRIHGLGICPVVRYCNELDLDGRATGEVEPYITLAKRIDKTTYDRLLIQHFNSWKVRVFTGMDLLDAEGKPISEAEREKLKIKLAQDSVLIASNSEARATSLPETPLDGIIRAQEADVKMVAVVSQTPVNALVGDLINISAEGLAGARASAEAKIREIRQSLGRPHDQLLRLGAHIVGDREAVADRSAHVTWADTSIRSLAEAADALGKMVTMLGVPAQGVWPMIPGVTRTDIEEWKMLLDDPEVMGAFLNHLQGASELPAAA